jgi:hypothetical protein
MITVNVTMVNVITVNVNVMTLNIILFTIALLAAYCNIYDSEESKSKMLLKSRLMLSLYLLS